MSKNKIVMGLFFILSIVGCNSKHKTKGDGKNNSADSTSSSKRGISKEIIIDLPVYAEVKVEPYSLDSMMAEVTIVNDWNEPVWLYKPILPSDTLVVETFYVRDAKGNDNLKHVYKQTDHEYVFSDQNFPFIIPVINDLTQLELKPESRMKFTTNLAKHYDFRQLINGERVKTILVNYGMFFPYIKDNKQVFKKVYHNSGDSIAKPVYINISIKKNKGKEYEFGLLKVELPEE